MEVIKILKNQPAWALVIFLACALAALPCITIDKDYKLATHPPTTYWPIAIGVLLAATAFVYAFLTLAGRDVPANGGLDLTKVKESGDVLSTIVNGCEIRVVTGRIEDYPTQTGAAIVLPCNEYFDDQC